MIHVVLYQPEIFLNTGNIIRTCYSTNAKLHIIKPISFDLHPKWLKRPATGKHLTDILHEVHHSYADFCQSYPDANIFYITRYGQKYHSEPDFASDGGDIFLMFGRESTGIPRVILQQNFDKCLRIPMTHRSRSLNLANAVSIVLYEVLRQLGYPNLSQFEVQKGKDFLLD